MEVGHVNGHEEDTSAHNLIWTCRACNVICGISLKRARLGRPTRQYNPAATGAKSLGQWLTAVTSMKGESDAMTVADAVAMIRATPPDMQRQFPSQIWGKRRERYGPTGRSYSPPF